jgi:SAM-dependent methyltransferase
MEGSSRELEADEIETCGQEEGGGPPSEREPSRTEAETCGQADAGDPSGAGEPRPTTTETGGLSLFAMINRKISDVQNSYDLVADEFVRRIFGELEHKPFDRQLLDRFAERVSAIGPVCDMGCGPGHIARYVHERGAQAIGIDLSPAMVEHARRLNPGIEFKQGDMRSLEIQDESFGGIAAFYSIIHIPHAEVVSVLSEMKRLLRPGGLLLLAFHIGNHVLHMEEWWGRQVSVDFVFYRTEEMQGFLDSAGFLVGEVVEREPYPDVEHDSRRAYILAEKRQESG